MGVIKLTANWMVRLLTRYWYESQEASECLFLLKLKKNHSIGRTHSLRFQFFKTQLCTMRGTLIIRWADDRKRYTATISRHRAVQQNTPRFFTPIRDADWSTQPCTGF